MSKKYIIYFSLICLLILGIFIWYKFNKNENNIPFLKNQSQIRINGKTLNVEIADTPELRQKGLSGREKIKKNQGMIFINERSSKYAFWMKDMKFDLDIIWVDENWKIVDITKNVKNEFYPQNYLPSTPAKYILEANAGWSEKNNIKIGDKVELKRKSSN